MSEPARAHDDDAVSLLVAGGSLDPNLDQLEARARARGLPLASLRVGPGLHPRVRWDLPEDVLSFDGRPLRPTAVFLRHDVFAAMQDPRPAVSERALAWYTLLSGWALAHEDVRVFNGRSRQHGANKPLALHLAARAGLRVPTTAITNDVAALRRGTAQPRVVKPIDGGALCEPLEDVLARTPEQDGVAARPAIVQERLVPPEVRVYVVGPRLLPFRVISEALDYRADRHVRVEPAEPLPDALGRALVELCDRLGLDWAAADFKTDPLSGELCFLEINSAPMFAAFDRACEGALADALLDWLLPARTPVPAPAQLPVER